MKIDMSVILVTTIVLIMGYVGMINVMKNADIVSDMSNWLDNNAKPNETILLDEFDWSDDHILLFDNFSTITIPRNDRDVDDESVINYLEEKPSYIIYPSKGRLHKVLKFSSQCQNEIKFGYSFDCMYAKDGIYKIYRIKKIILNYEFDSSLKKWIVLDTEKLYSSSQVFLRNGNLIIRGGIKNGSLASGHISSVDTFKYGFVEVRAKVCTLQGFTTQIWMTSKEWNSEIDILEKPAKLELCDNSVMYRNKSGDMIWSSNRLDKGSNCDVGKGYHLFQLEWTSEKLIWYVDGSERYREERPMFIPHTEMSFKIALCGGSGKYGCYPKDWGWDEDIDFDKLPSDFAIDYIRVYQNEEYS